MNPYLLISIIASIASIISLIISFKIKEARWIHAIYTFLLVGVVSLSIICTSKINTENLKLKSIETRASKLLDSYPSSPFAGENRGFILATFAFLERNKEEFPETYNMAKDLIENGLRITKSAEGKGVFEENDEDNRLRGGAKAMQALLKGLIEEDE